MVVIAVPGLDGVGRFLPEFERFLFAPLLVLYDCHVHGLPGCEVSKVPSMFPIFYRSIAPATIDPTFWYLAARLCDACNTLLGRTPIQKRTFPRTTLAIQYVIADQSVCAISHDSESFLW